MFALRVKGDSMIEDGIFDGDYIFVRKQLQANRGDIVVAMIGDEATVKRYYPEGDTIRFQPANAAMQPIMVQEAGLQEREPDRRRRRRLSQDDLRRRSCWNLSSSLEPSKGSKPPAMGLGGAPDALIVRRFCDGVTAVPRARPRARLRPETCRRPKRLACAGILAAARC